MLRTFRAQGLSPRLVWLTLAAAGVGGLLGLATPVATRWIVETLAPAGDLAGVAMAAAGLALVGVLAAFVGYKGGVWNQSAWIGWERSTMAGALGRLLAAPFAYHREKAPAGAIEILRGAVQAREALAAAGLACAVALAVLLASGAYLVWTAPVAGAGALAALGLLSVVAAALLRAQTRARLRAAHAESEETGFLSAALRASHGPGGASGRPHMIRRWAEVHHTRIDASRRALVARDGQRALDAAAGGLAPAGLIWLAAAGAPSAGELAAVYSAFGQCMMAALGLSAAAARLSQAEEGLRMLARMPAEMTGNVAADAPLNAPDEAAPAVAVEGLRFAYPGGEPILNNISLTLRPGETLALTGPSGVGKSTLIRLIGGLDAPSAGRVRLFGLDPMQLTPEDRRRLLGVAVSETPDFGGSPEEEAPGDASAEVIADLAALGAPRQTQIAVARAVGGHPKLVLIDEGIAGRDTAIADYLFARLKALGAAAIVATHDPTIAARCDRQVALEVVE